MSGSYWQDSLKEATDKFFKLYDANSQLPAELTDFLFSKKALGQGSFGIVLACIHTKTKRVLASKMINKEKTYKRKQVSHTLSEKRISAAIKFKFIVEVFYTIQDATELYLMMELIDGGELFDYTRSRPYFKSLGRKGLTEEHARFYAAQVILGFEFLNECAVLYRDLKPENTMIDSTGYLKMVDFGLAKYVPDRTYTFCGTLEYCAPELFLQKGYNKSVDMWALGVLIYEMVAGFPPFPLVEDDNMRFIEKVVNDRVKFPAHFSHELKTLVRGLLQKDVSKRLGCMKGGIREIKRFKWFGVVPSRNMDALDWNAVFSKQASATYLPGKKDGVSTKDITRTASLLKRTRDDAGLPDHLQTLFASW